MKIKRLLIFLVHCLALSSNAWVFTSYASGQCDAPAAWFPHSTTPKPDFSQPTSNCEFHQWAWQEFLWLTQPDDQGRIRLLSLPTAEMLFSPGRAPAPLELEIVQNQLKTQKLRLSPRVTKLQNPTTISAIRQAGSQGVVVDKNGNPVYYASFVSPEYYEFVRNRKLYLKQNYLDADDDLNFPVGAVELKSSWKIVESGDTTDGFFTTSAFVPKLKCTDGGQDCTGANIEIDLTDQREVTVALVGLHVVGILEGHPEFVWSTFEHQKNAPNLPAGLEIDSPNPVSNKDWTFYRAQTAAVACNQNNRNTLELDVTTGKLSPHTQIFRQFAFGGGDNQDSANIQSLNQSVHSQLAGNSVWKNYMLVGGVWFANGDNLEPGLNRQTIQQFVVGSVQVSNSTMETFTQNPVPPPRSNCFSCHTTRNISQLGAKNMNLSHILQQNLIDREGLERLASMNLSPRDAIRMSQLGFLKNKPFNAANLNALADSGLWTEPTDDIRVQSYADVKSLLDRFVEENNVPIQFSRHGAFWRDMSYQQFITRNIPFVEHPETGKPLKIIKVGNAEESNLIMSLRGTKGTIYDPETGLTGRMPRSGPFMKESDIQRLADWIDAGAPK